MEKYNNLLSNIKKLIESRLFTSKDIKKEVEGMLKFKKEILLNKLNLVPREEFEVQKNEIDKLRKDLNNFKIKKKKSKR